MQDMGDDCLPSFLADPQHARPIVLAKYFIAFASAVMAALGSIHLLYTFWGTRLFPRDPAVQAAMDATSLRLTAETTVWKAWLGFNASHSICAIFFGLVYGYLALGHPDFLLRSLYLQAVGLVVLVGFVILAKLYWFSIPFFGVSLALGSYVAGTLIAHLAAGRGA